MLSKETNAKVFMTSNLAPETTISGIVEGIFKKDDRVKVQFGNTKNKIESFDFYQSTYSFDKNISLIRIVSSCVNVSIVSGIPITLSSAV